VLPAAHGQTKPSIFAPYGLLNGRRTPLKFHFRKQSNRSVHEELLAFKLGNAKRMFRDSEAALAIVAERCGFTSLQYVCAVFQRELGCTPSRYRTQRSRR